MLKYAISIALASFLAIPAAMALPSVIHQNTSSVTSETIVDVQHRAAPPKARRAPPPRARRAPPPRRYAPGTRLRTAPHGYRRYSSRPTHWRTASCVQVGPLWYCP